MLLDFLKRPRQPAAPRVSVAVPLYNHARYIEAAIDSILQQGSVVREIVVIDDGSTDGSAAVMQRLAAGDARIVFEMQANQGAHATINIALARCTGEFVTILNSDDAYLPGRLAALVAALDAAPDADLAASALAFMDGAGKPMENAWYAKALAEAGSAPSMGMALINGNFLMTTSNFLFRRELLAQAGGFAALRYTHDLDFALRVLAMGKRILLLDKKLLRYRIHSTNTILEDHQRVRSEWAICAAAFFTSLLDQPGTAIDWPLAAALEDVFKEHQLAKAVHLVMAYLRRHGAGTLDRHPLLEDTAFLQLVAGWI
jgi:glycosyltransferase involved in cell wall biosynthesis